MKKMKVRKVPKGNKARRPSAAAPAFRHLLVPTDGSKEAAAGVRKAIALAGSLGARLRAVYVAPRTPPADYGLGAIHGADLLVEHFDDVAEAKAKKILDGVKAAAEAAGVPCIGEILKGREAWPALLEAAAARRCDLIVVAPHGRIEGGAPAGAATSILLLR